MTSVTWLATWDRQPVIGCELRVEIVVDDGCIGRLTVVGYRWETASYEGSEAAARFFLNRRVGCDWSEIGALESEDGDEMAVEAIDAERMTRLADALWDSAKALRESQISDAASRTGEAKP